MTTRSVLTLLCAAALLLGGCLTFKREAPRPGRTTLDAPLVVVPALSLGNFLLVETKWDRHGPYRFLVDTGSSATIVTPELARRYRAKNQPPEAMPQVRNRAARGGTTLMDTGVISELELDGARFEDVRVLIHDCRELSAHLGVRIDGILGFPLFRETVLTLDYTRSRLLLQPRSPAPLFPGVVIPFNNELRTPIIPLQLGEQSISALIDSGSDAPLSLNLAGLAADFAQLPRPGGAVGTLSGDHLQYIGRWRQPLLIGDYSVNEPIVDVTEELTALGGGILRHFTVTFDQERSQVTFHREERGPVVLSWADIVHGTTLAGDGHNVVLHEFAHKLDEENGAMDGVPALPDADSQRAWIDVMGREFTLLRLRARNVTDGVLDEYGASSPAEFFAVATEAFFERGAAMSAQHPRLYETLRTYYQVDPANWMESAGP